MEDKMEDKFKTGSVIKHKASNENMVVLVSKYTYVNGLEDDEVICRYFNRKDGQYCQKTFKKFEFD
jgi:uncharacterized protein YodC (DUF2158 family)